MAVDFTYDIGYMGVVKMGTYGGDATTGYTAPDNPTTVLATGGNITVQQTPIFTTGVWGAGWYNAAQQIAYAPNYITTTGSINFQLTYNKTVAAGGTDMFTQLQDFAFEKRNLGKYLYILPNGVAGYKGVGWCEGCSFTAAADALVTGDTSFKTGNVQDCIYTDVATDASQKGPNLPKTETNPIDSAFGDDYLDVFPFWASGVKLTNMSGKTEADISTKRQQQGTVLLRDDIMDWNTSYSSQLVLVATCANYKTLAESQQAKYAALGTMTAEGSFTIFRVAGDIDPNLIRACRHCTIQMGTAKFPAEKAKIKFGSVVFSQGSTDVQTGSSFIQSSFSFNALGNGQDPIMKLTAPNDPNEQQQ